LHTAGAGTPTVTQWQEKFNVNVHGMNDTEPKRSLPCPGVTKNDDAQITTYLGQTGAIGGGARSVTAIARERFRKLFSRLSRKHKQEVLDTQMHEQTWQNDHDNNRVFSKTCLMKVLAPDIEHAHPCPNCSSLLLDPRLVQALRQPRPKDENFIHINKRWRPSGTLVKLFSRVSGLREIIEESVNVTLLLLTKS